MKITPHAQFAFRRLDHVFDTAFGSGLNPLRNLGSLGFLFFWLLAISGIYIYAVLDTSASGAYRSIDNLSRTQWYLGGILRSVHRYAADGFILVVLAHLLREWVFGHFHGFRRFSWWTGVPLLFFCFACGIVGFWLNWDQLGQFSVQATAELLDWLPLFASPLTRNFINTSAVSDRLFSLFVFVHLGLPLLLLFGTWFHIQRISFAAVFPPRALAFGTMMTMVLLAAFAPVMSHSAADLATSPNALEIDWVILFIHPLMYVTSAGFIWGILVFILLMLFLLPLFSPRYTTPVAKVDPDNCNGCRRCFDDCPYAAVTMVPHPDRKMARQLAQVDTDLCASCGICVGSCPSSTPFRSAEKLITGIDLPQSPINDLRLQLRTELAKLKAETKIVVFGCQHAANVNALQDDAVAAIELICTGMLPPSFIEYALRDGASGVLITGCCTGGCEYRLGPQWTEERLLGMREPSLRASVPRERIQIIWADAGNKAAIPAALNELRSRITKLEKTIQLQEQT
jgi:coenzyme F420-reducing hydrogenase delta subunit/Pyruvate/2-oxoacid:ferredoxin oxidoreductase delta subunit